MKYIVYDIKKKTQKTFGEINSRLFDAKSKSNIVEFIAIEIIQFFFPKRKRI